ncbi:hypothetical protein H8959_006863 [Pygathrix nigripes]
MAPPAARLALLSAAALTLAARPAPSPGLGPGPGPSSTPPGPVLFPGCRTRCSSATPLSPGRPLRLETSKALRDAPRAGTSPLSWDPGPAARVPQRPQPGWDAPSPRDSPPGRGDPCSPVCTFWDLVPKSPATPPRPGRPCFPVPPGIPSPSPQRPLPGRDDPCSPVPPGIPPQVLHRRTLHWDGSPATRGYIPLCKTLSDIPPPGQGPLPEPHYDAPASPSPLLPPTPVEPGASPRRAERRREEPALSPLSRVLGCTRLADIVTSASRGTGWTCSPC